MTDTLDLDQGHRSLLKLHAQFLKVLRWLQRQIDPALTAGPLGNPFNAVVFGNYVFLLFNKLVCISVIFNVLSGDGGI